MTVDNGDGPVFQELKWLLVPDGLKSIIEEQISFYDTAKILEKVVLSGTQPLWDKL